MGKVERVGGSNWQGEVLDSTLPVVVDFGARWCPPCRMLEPILDRIAGALDGQVKVLKCDVDSDPELEARYGVTIIPNLLFFQGGEVVEQLVNPSGERMLTEKIKTTFGLS